LRRRYKEFSLAQGDRGTAKQGRLSPAEKRFTSFSRSKKGRGATLHRTNRKGGKTDAPGGSVALSVGENIAIVVDFRRGKLSQLRSAPAGGNRERTSIGVGEEESVAVDSNSEKKDCFHHLNLGSPSVNCSREGERACITKRGRLLAPGGKKRDHPSWLSADQRKEASIYLLTKSKGGMN